MPRCILDAGHGGNDRANVGPSGYVEADGNLDIVFRVREILKKYPAIEVFLTRESDITLDAGPRVKKVNDFKGDLIVSVHSNAGPESAHGSETYYSIHSPVGQRGHKAGNLIIKYVCLYADTYNRGAKTKTMPNDRNKNYYYIIRETVPPAVIVETAFHSNREEEQKLKTPEFRQKLAIGIARGIVEYFGYTFNEIKEEPPKGQDYKALYETELKVSDMLRGDINNLKSRNSMLESDNARLYSVISKIKELVK